MANASLLMRIGLDSTGLEKNIRGAEQKLNQSFTSIGRKAAGAMASAVGLGAGGWLGSEAAARNRAITTQGQQFGAENLQLIDEELKQAKLGDDGDASKMMAQLRQQFLDVKTGRNPEAATALSLAGFDVSPTGIERGVNQTADVLGEHMIREAPDASTRQGALQEQAYSDLGLQAIPAFQRLGANEALEERFRQAPGDSALVTEEASQATRELGESVRSAGIGAMRQAEAIGAGVGEDVRNLQKTGGALLEVEIVKVRNPGRKNVLDPHE